MSNRTGSLVVRSIKVLVITCSFFALTREALSEVLCVSKTTRISNGRLPLSSQMKLRAACKKNEVAVLDTALLTGPKGDAGTGAIIGAQGPQGEKGEKGERGERGDKGDTGPAGAKGEQGLQGIQGVAGPKGDTGAVGTQGPVGPQGVKGDKGDAGSNGVLDTSLCYHMAVGGYGTVTANCLNADNEFMMTWSVTPYWPDSSQLVLRSAEMQYVTGQVPTGMKVRMTQLNDGSPEGFTVRTICCRR
jgi:hypothetical protein